jgi:Ca-activated chloride channel family protein
LLDQLEPVEQASVSYRPRQALGYVPLLLALLLSFALALRQLLRSTSWHSGGAPQEVR